MDFTYSIWILLLPLISFLVIGLPEFVNKKYSWSHKTAGLIGTCSLGLVTALSYYTAFQYFTADRLADGTFATFVPYNVTCHWAICTSTSVCCSTRFR
jgi:NADH-quinone oxidoreductase subunit L